MLTVLQSLSSTALICSLSSSHYPPLLSYTHCPLVALVPQLSILEQFGGVVLSGVVMSNVSYQIIVQ